MTWQTIGIILNMVSMVAFPVIASKKGRSVLGWFFGGLLLRVLGPVIVACLKAKPKKR